MRGCAILRTSLPSPMPRLVRGILFFLWASTSGRVPDQGEQNTKNKLTAFLSLALDGRHHHR